MSLDSLLDDIQRVSNAISLSEVTVGQARRQASKATGQLAKLAPKLAGHMMTRAARAQAKGAKMQSKAVGKKAHKMITAPKKWAPKNTPPRKKGPKVKVGSGKGMLGMTRGEKRAGGPHSKGGKRKSLGKKAVIMHSLYVPRSSVMFEAKSRTSFRSCGALRAKAGGYAGQDHWAERDKKSYPLRKCWASIAGSLRQATARGNAKVVGDLQKFNSGQGQSGNYKFPFKAHGNRSDRKRPYGYVVGKGGKLKKHKQYGERSKTSDSAVKGRGGKQVTAVKGAYAGRAEKPKSKGSKKRKAAGKAVTRARQSGLRAQARARAGGGGRG
jgi:hypothetical protein